MSRISAIIRKSQRKSSGEGLDCLVFDAMGGQRRRRIAMAQSKAGRNTLPGRLLAGFINITPALSYRDVISGMRTIDHHWVLKSSRSIPISVKAKQPKQQKKHQGPPISKVVHDFTPLISILESHRKAGVNQRKKHTTE